MGLMVAPCVGPIITGNPTVSSGVLNMCYGSLGGGGVNRKWMSCKTVGLADLNDWVSSCQCLHCSPAALCLIVGSVVGLGLHLNLQAVRPRAGRQLPVEGWQGRAVGVKTREEGLFSMHLSNHYVHNVNSVMCPALW